jgi:hypothetical protein
MKVNNAAGLSRLTIGRFLAGIVGTLIILSFLLIAGSTPPTHAAGDIAFTAIDMNTAGNNTVSCVGQGCTPGTISSVETCAAVPVLGTVAVDIVVSGVPNTIAGSGAGPNIQGFDMDLIYNPAIVRVSALPANACAGGPPGNLDMQYAGTPGGSHSTTTDGTPDSDGDFFMSEADFGATGESGPGILIRLSLQGVAPGLSPLTLQYTLLAQAFPNIYDNTGGQGVYTIDTNDPSLIVVGGSCTATPTLTPSPSPPLERSVTVSASGLVVADGLHTSEVLVTVADASGAPVDDADVVIEVLESTLTDRGDYFSPVLRPDNLGNGVYRTEFTSTYDGTVELLAFDATTFDADLTTVEFQTPSGGSCFVTVEAPPAPVAEDPFTTKARDFFDGLDKVTSPPKVNKNSALDDLTKRQRIDDQKKIIDELILPVLTKFWARAAKDPTSADSQLSKIVHDELAILLVPKKKEFMEIAQRLSNVQKGLLAGSFPGNGPSNTDLDKIRMAMDLFTRYQLSRGANDENGVPNAPNVYLAWLIYAEVAKQLGVDTDLWTAMNTILTRGAIITINFAKLANRNPVGLKPEEIKAINDGLEMKNLIEALDKMTQQELQDKLRQELKDKSQVLTIAPIGIVKARTGPPLGAISIDDVPLGAGFVVAAVGDGSRPTVEFYWQLGYATPSQQSPLVRGGEEQDVGGCYKQLPAGGVVDLEVRSLNLPGETVRGDSGSRFPWLPPAAVAAALTAMLASGAWYCRRQWLR